jgi:hypothetical protein
VGPAWSFWEDDIVNNTETRQPTASKQFDRVHAAIWRQDKNEGGGEAWYSVSITRRYQDGNGQWQSSNQYSSRDLPHLQLAVEWAMRELLLKEE